MAENENAQDDETKPTDRRNGSLCAGDLCLPRLFASNLQLLTSNL